MRWVRLGGHLYRGPSSGGLRSRPRKRRSRPWGSVVPPKGSAEPAKGPAEPPKGTTKPPNVRPVPAEFRATTSPNFRPVFPPPVIDAGWNFPGACPVSVPNATAHRGRANRLLRAASAAMLHSLASLSHPATPPGLGRLRLHGRGTPLGAAASAVGAPTAAHSPAGILRLALSHGLRRCGRNSLGDGAPVRKGAGGRHGAGTDPRACGSAVRAARDGPARGPLRLWRCGVPKGEGGLAWRKFRL